MEFFKENPGIRMILILVCFIIAIFLVITGWTFEFNAGTAVCRRVRYDVCRPCIGYVTYINSLYVCTETVNRRYDRWWS